MISQEIANLWFIHAIHMRETRADTRKVTMVNGLDLGLSDEMNLDRDQTTSLLSSHLSV